MLPTSEQCFIPNYSDIRLASNVGCGIALVQVFHFGSSTEENIICQEMLHSVSLSKWKFIFNKKLYRKSIHLVPLGIDLMFITCPSCSRFKFIHENLINYKNWKSKRCFCIISIMWRDLHFSSEELRVLWLVILSTLRKNI